MRKNALLLIIYEVAIYLAPLITAPYVARVLGANGTGIYSYTYSIASYFILFVQLGVSLYGRREIASNTSKEKASNTFWEIFSVTTIAFAVVSAAYLAFVLCLGQQFRTELMIQYILLVGAWLDISWLFFGLEKFKIAITRNMIVKVLSLLLVFVFIKTPEDTNKYILLMALSSLASTLVMWITLPKHINRPTAHERKTRDHLKGMVVLFLPILAIQLYSITDKICLGLMTNMSEVGIYENVYKISRVPVAAITAIGTVMLPRITNMIANGKKKLSKKYIDKSLSATLLIGSACAFGLASVSHPFVDIYLGDEYASGAPVLQLLSLVLIIIAWGNVFRMQYILPNKMDKLYLKSVILGVITNILLNLLLIPRYNSFGAALASLASELAICIYQTVAIRKKFNMIQLMAANSKYVIGGAIMAAIVYAIGLALNGMNEFALLIMQIAIGALSYFIIIILFERMGETRILTEELVKLKRRIIK